MSSPLFRPFRALGYITDHVPFAVQRRGKDTFVTVSVGRAWQVYNCAKLTLSLVGPQLGSDIRALACKGDLTFAAVGSTIVECKRVQRCGVYRAHEGAVLQLLVLGDFLLSLGLDARLCVWKIAQYDKPQVVVQFAPGFVPTCMAHPDTYINKVLVGSEDRRLQLWNFMSPKMVFEFAGWKSAVRCISPAPALDVVGIGLADGRAILHHLKFDETVVAFENASGVGLSSGHALCRSSEQNKVPAGGGATTAISFRTGAGKPLMAAGGGAGVVTVWDLQEKRLHTVLTEAHDAPLVSLHFFAGEPLLMSSAKDNSLKHWAFDSSDSMPRLLRFRSGHSAPPTRVRHYGQGLHLLSAGQDRALRLFSTIQDQQSRELSQKHTARKAKRQKVAEQDVKLARLVAMDAAQVRERDWCNVITAHEGDPNAYTWRLRNFTLGEHILRPPQYEKASQGQGDTPDAPVTAVAISACGNFGIVGTAAGRLDRYNLQSGKHRGSYMRKPQPSPTSAATPAGNPAQLGAQTPEPGAITPQTGAITLHSSANSAQAGGNLTQGGRSKPGGELIKLGKRSSRSNVDPSKVETLENAHAGPVVGLAMDGANQRLVSLGSNGNLKVWQFKTFKLVSELEVEGGGVRLAMHPTSMLCAVATEEHVVHMFDVEAARRVRSFRGHKDRITDMQISEDGKWLLTSSMDSTVRVWDIPMARCLQVMRLGSPVTSLSLAPGLDMLATVHINRRGIYLWANQLLFGTTIDICHSDKPVDVHLPTIAAGTATSRTAALDDADDEAGAAAKLATLIRDDDTYNDEDVDSVYADSDDEASTQTGDGGNALAVINGGGIKVYERSHATGGPQPLTPELVTLSLLPRSQWEGLVYLDAIKARNKPIEPPKKPEAAPFFLPTVPNMEGVVQFDASTAQVGEGDSGLASKVLKRKGAGKQSTFLRLLHAGADSGDYTSFMSHLRNLPPATIDLELRAGQLLEGSAPEEVGDVDMLLQCIDQQLATNTNFEFCQALLRLVLQVHGEALVHHEQLRNMAIRIQERLKQTWGRLDGLLQNVRCMVAFFGNLQA